MPVEFWASADSKVSESDQQMLTSYFYNKLEADLSKNFTLVNQVYVVRTYWTSWHRN